MKKLTLSLTLLLTLLLITTSCATIMHGSKQTIPIISEPYGAKVIIDGMNRGVTPCEVTLERNNSHSLQMVLDGYSEFDTQITPSLDGWVIGNLLFGGIPGFIIDIATGSANKLPTDYHIILMKQ